MLAIAALTPSRGIGFKGRLPWHLPADLRFFKQTTLGHVVLMGRTTFTSIGKPLPGRENWVLSTSAGPLPGVRVLASAAEVAEPSDGRRLFVIGGASVYRCLLGRCDELLLTQLAEEHPVDTWFPEYDRDFEPVETLLEDSAFVVRRFRRL